MQETRTTCCYCGVGCGVIVRSESDRIIDVLGDQQHPANFGRLCTKGSTLHLSAKTETRILEPEMRLHRDSPRIRLSWEKTLGYVAERFASIIREHGPDAVAFYISGQLLTEDYYVFNKLTKGLIGTNNIDTNSRLCMSSAVSGYKATLGADAPPACYEDIDHANCLFIAGSNTAYAHPVLFRRIEDARAKNPSQKLIVVDPRRTETAQAADLHLAILPGTDVALFNGMLHLMLWEGLLDTEFIREHTEGFEVLKDTVREYTPKMVAGICGIPEADVITAAKWFSAGPTLSLYCQGLNQSTSGTDKNTALINLHLATGQIGKPGTGPLSLTGQPNAMGGREVGGMANLLSAHRDLNNPNHRAEIAKFWGIDQIPETSGKTAVDMFEALRKGSIKAIWIACTNPAHSMPDLNRVHEALSAAELVVVQDAFYDTDTNAFADVLLPATTWGEKDGTVTNSERRISRVRPAVNAPGAARHDWQIAVDFARRLGLHLNLGDKATSLFPYTRPEEIFEEHRETTRGRDLDITGLSYQLLDSAGPQQWPYTEKNKEGKSRLYEDGIFQNPNGKARFANTIYKGLADRTDTRYPLHLLTGRLRDQWHGMSRTGNVASLFNHVEEPFISMNPDDMMRRNIQEGDLVKVSNKRGQLVLRARSSDQLLPTQTFIPMHWGSQYMHGHGVNALMSEAFDKVSHQPELKHTAIKLEKLELLWHMTVMRSGNGLTYLRHIRPLLRKFTFATCGLFGTESGAMMLRVAHETRPEPHLIEEIDRLLDMTDNRAMLQYNDHGRGISKRIIVEGNRIIGVRLSGETLATDWLKDVMLHGELTEELRRWALAPLNNPPSSLRCRGRIICNCLDVSESEIIDDIEAGADLVTLQNKRKCGTQCGSCLPELKQLVVRHTIAMPEPVAPL